MWFTFNLRFWMQRGSYKTLRFKILDSAFEERNLEELSSWESLKKNLCIMAYSIISPQGDERWKIY